MNNLAAQPAKCLVCSTMVALPAGTFMMGSPAHEEGRSDEEGPQRRVTIEAFEIGMTEVTFAEWDACVAAGGCNGYSPIDMGWGRGSRPVIFVSWYDAQAYVAWLSERTGKAYRLPTEAEWEYAARAGTTTAFSSGATISTAQANFIEENMHHTAPVGSLPPNAWGLNDFDDNVAEWVEDCYHEGYRGAPADGRAWSEQACSSRVVRGEARISGPARSAARGGLAPSLKGFALGFRVARTLTP